MTRVLCSATGVEQLPHWLHQNKERHGRVTAEYALLARTAGTRTGRAIRDLCGRSAKVRDMAEGALVKQAALDAMLCLVGASIHQLLRLQSANLDERAIDYGIAK